MRYTIKCSRYIGAEVHLYGLRLERQINLSRVVLWAFNWGWVSVVSEGTHLAGRRGAWSGAGAGNGAELSFRRIRSNRDRERC